MSTKFVLVTGGVISGLGKGISTSSVAQLLQKCGLVVTCIKIDPYINVDPGTMSPYEHGEVFVLDDGGEVDLDLGTYERFLNINLTCNHNITTGKIYQHVISKERQGKFLGKTVQVVPHITDAIQEWITKVAKIPVTKNMARPDVCMIELGGTVGDIEGSVFQEAMRQFRVTHEGDFCHIHVSLIPTVQHQKSKPTQHGVRELRSHGLQPDLIFCRCESLVERSIRDKIAMFCMVPISHVISMHNVNDTYEIPSILYSQNVHTHVLKKLNYNFKQPLSPTNIAITYPPADAKTLTVAVVGKYTGQHDAYMSITKSFTHAARKCGVNLKIKWVEANIYSPQSIEGCAGLLVPGGFGNRGVAGKLEAIRYARETNLPFLGICMGFQLAVIEYARNVCGLEAISEEWKEDKKVKINEKISGGGGGGGDKDDDSDDGKDGKDGKDDNDDDDGNDSDSDDDDDDDINNWADLKNGIPIIVLMPDHSTKNYGGTLRLGKHEIFVQPGTKVHKIYKSDIIYERHRHRYEVDPNVRRLLEEKDQLVFSAKNKDGDRAECMEIKSHPFFVASQFHPEFTSRQNHPSPLFEAFVKSMQHNLQPQEDTICDL